MKKLFENSLSLLKSIPSYILSSSARKETTTGSSQASAASAPSQRTCGRSGGHCPTLESCLQLGGCLAIFSGNSSPSRQRKLNAKRTSVESTIPGTRGLLQL